MKRMVAGLLVLGLVSLILVAPTPAVASGRFWTGFAVGGATGLVLGSAFASPYYVPPAVVYEPAPVYVTRPPVYYYPPQPIYGTPPPGIYTQPQWVWNGYGWVLLPGYWRY